jgi:hypothetical protein
MDVLRGAEEGHVTRDDGFEVVFQHEVHRGEIRGDVRGEEKTEERRVLDGETVDRRQDARFREVDEQIARQVPVSVLARTPAQVRIRSWKPPDEQSPP